MTTSRPTRRNLPPLPAVVAALHHLLVLPAAVPDESVATLLRALEPGAAWRSAPTRDLPGELDLLAGEAHDGAASFRATLTGPWRLDLLARADLALPAWAVHAFVLDTPPERSAPPPGRPHGYGPLLDAFPDGHPVGLELAALEALRAVARRLEGGLRTTTGEVIVPDPALAVDRTLYAPAWLSPAALAAVLDPALPGIRMLPGVSAEAAEELDGYGALWHPHGHGDPEDAVLIEVEAAEVLPAALAAATWTASGVLTYRLRWLAQGERRDPATRAGRRLREDAAAAIAAAARALQTAVGGLALDEDGLPLEGAPGAPSSSEPQGNSTNET